MNVCDLNKTLIKFDMNVEYSCDIFVPVIANIVWNRVNADCTHLDLVHKTSVDEVPTAIASFQGRILVGVGRMLRLYDMGRKKLLRKCENKVSDMNVICESKAVPVLCLGSGHAIYLCYYGYVHWPRNIQGSWCCILIDWVGCKEASLDMVTVLPGIKPKHHCSTTACGVSAVKLSVDCIIF